MRLDDQSPEIPAHSDISAPVDPAPLPHRNVLYQGDCLDILARLPAGSVDMILCDLPYGRIIARCTASGVDLAEVLVAEGLVWAYRRYSDDYTVTEDQARLAGLGIWRAATEPPWDYRADRWERTAAEAPENCPIKGNINGEGERIYHTPWSPWYSRTKINEATGERWFCDESAALTAGWRAARFR